MVCRVAGSCDEWKNKAQESSREILENDWISKSYRRALENRCGRLITRCSALVVQINTIEERGKGRVRSCTKFVCQLLSIIIMDGILRSLEQNPVHSSQRSFLRIHWLKQRVHLGPGQSGKSKQILPAAKINLLPTILQPYSSDSFHHFFGPSEHLFMPRWLATLQ